MNIANLSLTTLIISVFMVSRAGGTYNEEICRGRYESYYSFDYFHEGGLPIGYFTQTCFLSTYYCQFFQFINRLMATNVIDMILIFKVLLDMKSHTKSASDLLTSNALKERKR